MWLPRLDLKLSFRLPPTTDAAIAAAAVKTRLEADPPYGARVTFDVGSSLAGWDAPAVAPWLENSMREASQAAFGREAMYLGTGGSIPFIGMPRALPGRSFVTGVLGRIERAAPNNSAPACAEMKVCRRILADHCRREAAERSAASSAPGQ
jgi:hypothetical protein